MIEDCRLKIEYLRYSFDFKNDEAKRDQQIQFAILNSQFSAFGGSGLEEKEKDHGEFRSKFLRRSH